MVVAPRFDVGVRQEEYREDDSDHVPSREDESAGESDQRNCMRSLGR